MIGDHDDLETATDIVAAVVPDDVADGVPADIERSVRSDLLRKRRTVDLALAGDLVSRGWRQGGVLDGLQWCVTCNQPTVWIDPTGKPRHHTCTDLF